MDNTGPINQSDINLLLRQLAMNILNERLEKGFPLSDEHSHECNKLVDLSERLKGLLAGQSEQLFAEFHDQYDHVSTIEAHEYFVHGYIMGYWLHKNVQADRGGL